MMVWVVVGLLVLIAALIFAVGMAVDQGFTGIRNRQDQSLKQITTAVEAINRRLESEAAARRKAKIEDDALF